MPNQNHDRDIYELSNEILLVALSRIRKEGLYHLEVDYSSDGSTRTTAISHTIGLSDIRALAKDKWTQMSKKGEATDIDNAHFGLRSLLSEDIEWLDEMEEQPVD